MNDLISRQAVIDCFKKWQPYMATRLHEFENELSELPSVAIPNKTGRWIWQTEDIYQCSECHEDIHVKEVMNKPQYICCPICGCPMEIER